MRDSIVNVSAVRKPLQTVYCRRNGLENVQVRTSHQRRSQATAGMGKEQGPRAMLLVSVKTVLNPAQEIDEAKLAALVAIEASQTFQRHEQLRAFLRFVCEYEMAGRGDDLHEYLIGVEVLGQKSGYSTMENSVVRNRAHTLRKKLAEYYAGEGSSAPLRIEIPKGSYCPHYINAHIPGPS